MCRELYAYGELLPLAGVRALPSKRLEYHIDEGNILTDDPKAVTPVPAPVVEPVQAEPEPVVEPPPPAEEPERKPAKRRAKQKRRKSK